MKPVFKKLVLILLSCGLLDVLLRCILASVGYTYNPTLSFNISGKLFLGYFIWFFFQFWVYFLPIYIITILFFIALVQIYTALSNVKVPNKWMLILLGLFCSELAYHWYEFRSPTGFWMAWTFSPGRFDYAPYNIYYHYALIYALVGMCFGYLCYRHDALGYSKANEQV